jgi:hypothetical protein
MIKSLDEYSNESLVLLNKYQTGEIKLTKTNRPWLDNAGGIIPRSIIGILGASFSGKTTELQSLTEDIMNIEVNEDASEYVSLAHAFEMTNFSLTLKSIKNVTGKKFIDILGEGFDEKDKVKLKEYFNNKLDGRFFVNHDTGTPKEIGDMTEEFLKKNIDKKLCLVSLDHSALLKSKSGNKKEAIDDMLERFNDFKQIYANFILIILTQANRSTLTKIGEKSNEMKLSRDSVYASDTLFHIVDTLYGLQNAYYLGVEEYRKIRPSKYPNLEHRFTDEDKNGKVSLYSEGCIFVEILKDRMADDLDFIDLYTIEIKPFNKETDVHNFKKESKMPIFLPDSPVPRNFDVNLAFGKPDISEDDTDPPF